MPTKKAANSDISKLKYEQAYEKLEQIVNRMSEASVPLDELMQLYESGMALGEHCEKLLSGYEAKMEMVARSQIAKELAALENPVSGEPEDDSCDLEDEQ